MGPAALSPAKAASSHFWTVSRVANIFMSLSWFHVTDTSSVMSNHMLSVKSILGLREIFLRGKDVKSYLVVELSFTLFYIKPCR